MSYVDNTENDIVFFSYILDNIIVYHYKAYEKKIE